MGASASFKPSYLEAHLVEKATPYNVATTANYA